MDRAVPCKRCGAAQSQNGKPRGSGLCGRCELALHRLATEWQERDYLHSYLHGHAEDTDRHTEKLRAKAERLGINWAQELPRPMTFDTRLARVSGRPPPQRKRKHVA